MEIQLQELIDQIKKDGVEAAEAEAVSILNAAKSEAEKATQIVLSLVIVEQQTSIKKKPV